MKPSISIVLPTFNGARFIAPQIESILAQTFSDFELIIADDGSSDGTVALLRDFAERDRRIRLLAPDDANRGQKVRLMQLLEHAQGDLVSFSDQDDVWATNKLDLLAARLGRADLAFGPSRLIDAEDKELGSTLLEAMGLPVRPHDRLRALFHPLVSAHAMLVRRVVVHAASFSRLIGFDWLISLDAIYRGGLTYVEEAVTLHRIHGGNQNNGDARYAAHLRHRPSLLRLPRSILPSGDLDRFVLWRRMEHLATSPVVPGATRRAFATICAECEQAWFIDRGTPFQRVDADLRSKLKELLRPFAETDADWRESEQLIDTVISPLRSTKPANVTR